MTIIVTEIQKWKRNKIVWCILALTLLFGAFAIERACSIARSSPYMDSFGDLYTLAFKNLSSLFLPIVLGMFATTLFFDEQKNDTLKELLIIPITKAQLYFSKVAVVILMSVELCLITFLLCVVGGLIAGGFPDLNAHTLMDAGLLYLAGGLLVPIAMLPIVFLATLSKADCVSCHAVKRIYSADWRDAALSGSRSHCPCLSYGNTPAGKRDGDLSTYFPSSRRYGRKPDARRFAPYFAACLWWFAAPDRCRICRRIRCGSKKAILLKGKTYETIDLFIPLCPVRFFALRLPAGRPTFQRGSRPAGYYRGSDRIL